MYTKKQKLFKQQEADVELFFWQPPWRWNIIVRNQFVKHWSEIDCKSFGFLDVKNVWNLGQTNVN